MIPARYLCLLLLAVMLAVPVGAATLNVTPALVGGAGWWATRNSTWATAHDASPGSGTNTAGPYAQIYSDLQTNTWQDIERFTFSADTSTLPDTSTITGATLTFKTHATTAPVDNFGGSIDLVSFNPANPTAVAAADYDKFGTSLYATKPVSEISTATSYTITLTNLTGINKTGYTTFGFLINHDRNNTAPTWQSSKKELVRFSPTEADYALNITYTGGAPIAAFTTNNSECYAKPCGVAFTDTTSNAPTSWNWSFDDGTFSDEQNPAHSFTNYGQYHVNLTATNADGSSSYVYNIGVIDPAGWSDTFTIDTSGNYTGEKSSFIWDTTNGVLNATEPSGDPGKTMYYNGSPFFNATYEYDFTLKKYGWTSDIYGGFLFGGQDNCTGSWITTCKKYVIYIKNDTANNINSLILATTDGIGGHSELVQYTKDWDLQAYHIKVNWTPFSATESINITLNGTPVISSNNKNINQSGLTGFAIHPNCPDIIWWDNLNITPEGWSASSTPVASFTTNTSSGTVPLAVAFTDTSSNSPTGWNWSFGDGNWSNGTSSTASYLYEYPGTYNAYLIASNGGGSSTSTTTAITVSALPTSLQCQNQTGNITINLFSNSTTTLGWNWQDPGNITQIAEDGLFVTNFDNSSDYFIGTGYLPETWHKLKIYNSTDYGQLNCTTDAVPVTPTPIPIMPSTESTAGTFNPVQYWWIGAGALGIILLFRKW